MNNNNWNDFAIKVKYLCQKFEVLRRAVDEGWGEYDSQRCEERVVEDLLLNFAECLENKREITPQDINRWFVATFDDFFDADITDSATEISIALADLFRKYVLELR